MINEELEGKITITNYDDKKIDLNIFGNHFSGNRITKYEIVNDVGTEKLIVEFIPTSIEKIDKRKKESE